MQNCLLQTTKGLQVVALLYEGGLIVVRLQSLPVMTLARVP
jgi:hypothetical protein